MALLLLAASASSQDAPIKIEVPNVIVDVVVTDRKGHPVYGLNKESFTVLEDNVPQEIVSLTAPEPASPENNITPAKRSDSESLPTSASKPSIQPERQRKSITLLIDSGGLRPFSLKDACTAAAKYVEKTVPADTQISIYWVDSSLHLAVPFTSDKQRLLQALDKLSATVSTGRMTASDRVRTQQRIDDLFVTIHPETLNGSEAFGGRSNPMAGGLVVEMNMLRSWLVISNNFQARAIYMALRALALGYRDLPGRKRVVIFSEGFLHAPDVVPQMQAVIDAANRAGVSFYVIDASGPGSPIDADSRAPDIGGHRADPNPRIDGFSTTLGQDVFDWIGTLSSDVHSDLGNIANATGGFLVNNTTNLLPALERIERDGSEFYTLVYHPTNRTYDGAFRKIKVTLDGGYHLRYRQGYWGIPPGREVMMTPGGAQLLSAIQSGSQKSTFTPDLQAALVQSRAGGFSVPVAVSLPGSSVPFAKKKDHYSSGVTMLLIARDASGQLVSVYERYDDLAFNKQEWETFRQETFNVNGHTPVPSMEPITVQAIVQFSSNHAIGMSAPVPVHASAPDATPRLTSIVLASKVTQADCEADPTDPLCLKSLRLYFPAHARFLPSDNMTVYFTALDLKQTASVGVTFQLVTNGQTLAIKPIRLQAVPGSAAGSLMVLGSFDLKTLKPGNYTLQANVEDTVSHSKSSGRASFAVN